VLELLAGLSLQKVENEERKKNSEGSHLLKKQAISLLTQALELMKHHFPSSSPHFTRIRGKLSQVEVSLAQK
jgi:hypothetical protein